MNKLFVLLCFVAFASGCEDTATPTVITMADVAGSYSATDLRTTTDGSTVDQLAAGSELTLGLNAVGTTTGRLFVPEGDEDGSDFEADLAGTWSLSGAEVTFDHAADTFIRDMVFTFSDGELRGDETFGDTRVQVVLTRQ